MKTWFLMSELYRLVVSLRRAYFCEARPSGANLSGADLSYVKLRQAARSVSRSAAEWAAPRSGPQALTTK